MKYERKEEEYPRLGSPADSEWIFAWRVLGSQEKEAGLGRERRQLLCRLSDPMKSSKFTTASALSGKARSLLLGQLVVGCGLSQERVCFRGEVTLNSGLPANSMSRVYLACGE